MIPLPVETAFDFVSNPENWPKFLPTNGSIRALHGWGTPGGTASVVTRVLGRDIHAEFEVIEWDRPHRLRYVARAPGRPDVDNARDFAAAPDGTRLTATTSLSIRHPPAAILDLLTAVALRRTLRYAMRSLPAAARA